MKPDWYISTLSSTVLYDTELVTTKEAGSWILFRGGAGRAGERLSRSMASQAGSLASSRMVSELVNKTLATSAVLRPFLQYSAVLNGLDCAELTVLMR